MRGVAAVAVCALALTACEREKQNVRPAPVRTALFRDAAGYLSHELRRSVENEHHYALLVEWRRLEDHTLAFVRSNAFERLREILQGFLVSAPEVEHFLAVAPRGAQVHLAD